MIDDRNKKEKDMLELSEESLEHFKKGLRELDELEDGIEDPRILAMRKNKENANASFRLFRKHVMFKKLSTLEETISNGTDDEIKGVIAMYLYFHKSDKIVKSIYPNLFSIMNDFEKSVQLAKDNDPYFEVFKVYELVRNKEKAMEFSSKAREYIKTKLEESNLSLKQLSDFTGIKYANLYNFIVKEQDGKLGLRKAHVAMWSIWGLSKGMTREESMKLHHEKMKTLWLDWSIIEK